MSDQQYIKGACVHCGGRIEFPAAAAGRSIPCPHCQRTTPLTAPGAAPLPVATALPVATPVAAPPPPPTPAPAAVKAVTAAPAGNLKCACSHCNGRIEFPSNAVGLAIACPHCGKQTVLTGPPPPPPGMNVPRAAAPVAATAAPAASRPQAVVNKPAAPAAVPVAMPPAVPVPAAEPAEAPARGKGKSKALLFAVVGVAALALIGGGVMIVLKKKSAGAGGSKPGEPAAADKKSGAGLELVRYDLQKAKDGGLVYVIGSVTNHSDKQFFNLKVQFNVLDQAGTSLGDATDYTGNIGPHAAWAFKALVLEEGAKQIKLADFHFEKE